MSCFLGFELNQKPNTQVAGDRVALQRVTLDVPAGHDLAGLIFVVRSADSTVWWRDGALCLPVWVP